MSNFVEEIEKVPGVAVRSDELLSLHTTLAVGGPCDFMVWVSSKHALKAVLGVARKFDLPVTVLGNGSNVLVRDGGIPGLVLRLVDDFADIAVNGLQIRAGAGASLAEVVNRATAAGIGGLEFLAGIPGTIGGAIVTNAGAKDTWISSCLRYFTVLTESLDEVTYEPGEVAFGYRSSGIAKGWIVTDAMLAGYGCGVDEARSKVEKYLAMRSENQPRGEKTAGCIFKNPPGEAAGRLIEAAGFKGHRKGGAEVSRIHANWIVNTGGATAGEILDLIEEIRSKVKERFGIALELEIQILGRD